MCLIRRWLRVPLEKDGKLTKRRMGVPQEGGTLRNNPVDCFSERASLPRWISPLLSNIILHELDKEMEKQGLRFVRYADDLSIYFKTKAEARKAGNSIYIFLRDKLKLPINRDKSGIRRPVQFQILGYGFVPIYQKGVKGKYQLIVSSKRWKSFKFKLKELTKKTKPMSFDERIRKLNQAQRGWLDAFKYANIKGKLSELDGWLRNRLRYCIWHHWKKPERKRKNLIRLGVDQNHAYAWSRSRMGGWAIAQSPILGTTITKARLVKRGYVSLLSMYEYMSPKSFNYTLFPMI